MVASFEFVLLCLCWIGALATLLIFLETCFALSGKDRFMAGRASGAYGVISVLVPMRGSARNAAKAIQSIFVQSYPFIELFLIYPREDRAFADLAKKFQSTRSHIPVRLIETTFPIVTEHDSARALEQCGGNTRGRWLVTLDSSVVLDRFAIETAVEFAGSNEISALALRPGTRCRTALEKWIAPAREHFLQVMRTVKRRQQRPSGNDTYSSFLLVNREAFEAVNRVNRMPGILNEAGWNIWSYQVEGLRAYEADGSRWIWREIDFAKERPPAAFVAASAALTVIAVAGLIYGVMHGTKNFAGASILAFSAVSYSLMAVSYFLFARRLRASAWFAPLWFVPHFLAAVLTAFHPLERPLGDPGIADVIEIVKDGKGRGDSDRG